MHATHVLQILSYFYIFSHRGLQFKRVYVYAQFVCSKQNVFFHFRCCRNLLYLPLLVSVDLILQKGYGVITIFYMFTFFQLVKAVKELALMPRFL